MEITARRVVIFILVVLAAFLWGAVLVHTDEYDAAVSATCEDIQELTVGGIDAIDGKNCASELAREIRSYEAQLSMATMDVTCATIATALDFEEPPEGGVCADEIRLAITDARANDFYLGMFSGCYDAFRVGLGIAAPDWCSNMVESAYSAGWYYTVMERTAELDAQDEAAEESQTEPAETTAEEESEPESQGGAGVVFP